MSSGRIAILTIALGCIALGTMWHPHRVTVVDAGHPTAHLDSRGDWSTLEAVSATKR